MSHEIRTPIAGVIGMSELFLDTELDADQRECGENIQRSVSFDVINNIFDLSKVESGWLNIEGVQFTLAVVIQAYARCCHLLSSEKTLLLKVTFESAAIKTWSRWGILIECNKKLVQQGHRISIRWVPSHSGLEGNERADKSAEELALGERVPKWAISTHVKRQITDEKKLQISIWHEEKIRERETGRRGFYIPCCYG